MPRFEENQRISGGFRNVYLGVVAAVFAAGLIVLGIAIAAGGETWSRVAVPTGWAVFPVLCLCILSMTGLRLKIRVDDQVLRVQVWPLAPSKKIPSEQIRSVHQRTVRPFREFGGWGVRVRRGHLLYSVGGTNAVTVEYFYRGKDRKLTITTERGDELAAALSL